MILNPSRLTVCSKALTTLIWLYQNLSDRMDDAESMPTDDGNIRVGAAVVRWSRVHRGNRNLIRSTWQLKGYLV